MKTQYSPEQHCCPAFAIILIAFDETNLRQACFSMLHLESFTDMSEMKNGSEKGKQERRQIAVRIDQ